MSMKLILEENKIAVLITLAILLVGSIAYFASSIPAGINQISELPKDTLDAITKDKIDPAIYDNMEFKVAYTSDGAMKIFANADASYLTELKTEEGNNVPGKFSVVLGFNEANIMKEEKLFSAIGNKLEDFFGLSVTVGGILKQTDTPIDSLHFLSEKQYAKLEGEENSIFIKTTVEGEAKVYYTYQEGYSKLNLRLEEGDLSDFRTYEMLGRIYYPLILGSKEAESMRAQKEFSEPGDVIQNLFGKSFVVIGVLEETDTIADYIHFTTASANELG